ncbi:MAG: sensor histidine kinase [bacterium]
MKRTKTCQMSTESYEVLPKMHKISNKLAIIFGLLIFVTIFVCGWYFYGQTRHYLDQELGRRLVDIAQTIALQVHGDIIAHLIPGDESSLTYRRMVSRLHEIKQKTEIERVYIFDKNHRSLLDTEPVVPIGTEYLKLKFDQLELESVWQKKGMASVLFMGEDGNYYKSGYAPVLVNGKIIAVVGVDASASFLKILKRFRHNVLSFGLAFILIGLAIGYIVSKTITNPVHTLVSAIENISSGDFKTEIKVNTHDEIGFLGKTIEQLRLNILKRDAQMKLMLANVAHEIRNPLGGIELFAGILAEELGQMEDRHASSTASIPAREHLEKITREVRKLNQIITEFLDFAKPKPPRKKEVFLEELIQAAYSVLALEFERANVTLESKIEPLARISVDPDHFKQVFINLFKNSLQALQHYQVQQPDSVIEGKIVVQSETRDGWVKIKVIDNGPGIPLSHVPSLFEPFFTTKEKGAGLGLAIVHKIITDHDAHIEIRSQEGKSTTAIIRIKGGMSG